MRGLVPGLDTRHPLGRLLPALFQEDRLMQRFLTAFDDALAPILCTLDNLDAYLDPQVAPADYVEWLSWWVGVGLDEDWSTEQQRRLVARAAELYRWRGTAKGMSELVGLYAGVTPEIEESGGATWSPTPNAQVPGTWPPRVTVRLRVTDPSALNRSRLETLVASATPAGVIPTVEVLAA